MRHSRPIATGLVSLFALSNMIALSAACGSSPKKRSGPCTLGELAACGAACSATTPCPTGLSCDDNVCGAECTSATAVRDCGAGGACTVDGTCIAPVATDGGGKDAGTGDGGNPSTPPGGDGGACADVVVDTSKVTPNVVLIIDQSGSMTQPLGNSTRWEALRGTLLANDGILNEFATTVRFGLALYSARESDPEPRVCPLVTQVAVSMDNVAEIRRVYQAAEPIADTPTGDSIDVVLNSVQQAGLLEIDARDPTIFILATDGEPDRCEQLNPQNGQAESVAAIERAFDAGVRTYVIAVANEADIRTQHLQDIANAGVGGTNAPSYRVNDDTGLRQVLRTVINRELKCDVELFGTVDLTTVEPCAGGSVTVGDSALVCDDANGYSLNGASSLTLRGEACTKLKAGGTLRAKFPCNSIELK